MNVVHQKVWFFGRQVWTGLIEKDRDFDHVIKSFLLYLWCFSVSYNVRPFPNALFPPYRGCPLSQPNVFFLTALYHGNNKEGNESTMTYTIHINVFFFITWYNKTTTNQRKTS